MPTFDYDKTASLFSKLSMEVYQFYLSMTFDYGFDTGNYTESGLVNEKRTSTPMRDERIKEFGQRVWRRWNRQHANTLGWPVLSILPDWSSEYCGLYRSTADIFGTDASARILFSYLTSWLSRELVGAVLYFRPYPNQRRLTRSHYPTGHFTLLTRKGTEVSPSDCDGTSYVS